MNSVSDRNGRDNIWKEIQRCNAVIRRLEREILARRGNLLYRLIIKAGWLEDDPMISLLIADLGWLKSSVETQKLDYARRLRDDWRNSG